MSRSPIMVYPNQPDPFQEDPQNQAPAYVGRNLYDTDPLITAMAAQMSPQVRSDLKKLGEAWGSAEAFQLAHLANKEAPVLKTHNDVGKRIDRVEYHPAYHALMRRSVTAGLQSSVWDEDKDASEAGMHHQVRAVRFYLAAQVETGHLCPISITNAAPAALRHNPLLAQDWVPRIRGRNYDATARPATQKKSITIGLATAEKQSGSDPGLLVSRAQRANGDIWVMNGHKWHVSAPMGDAFLTLAQTDNGPSCFFLPRHLPDGRLNNIRIQRLKQKLGGTSNAAAELEFHQSAGYLIGAEGHGTRTLTDMLALTRLDSALASAGLMRTTLAQAVHNARHRIAGGRKLVDQPLMARVLADLSLDCAAATVLSLRLAEAFDRAGRNPGEALFARLMTPVIRYWTAKCLPAFIAETMECMGGNGFSDDVAMARYYCAAPAQMMWEGSGNLMCMDVLKALRGNPESLQAVLSVVDATFGGQKKALTDVVRQASSISLTDEGSARIFTEQLALTVAAGELQRIARSDIADAFLDGRLNRPYRSTYGMMDNRFNARGIVEAMYPA